MNKMFSYTYVVVLNWNAAQDTINCIQSLLRVKCTENLKIIICDNSSSRKSYEDVKDHVLNINNISSLIIDEDNIFEYKNVDEKIVLIRNNANYGYAGGNNIGIKFSLNQEDMNYVWILNNDTVVHVDALVELLTKIQSNKNYGVCGCCLVDYDSKEKIQGIGGLINKWSFTAKEIGSNINLKDNINEIYYENQIDYVIGASFLISKECLLSVGLLCEDYFLYFEEYDYCVRVRKNNFFVGIASRSIIYHKHGASTNKGKSDIADYCSVKNRLIISKKFHPKKILFAKFFLVFALFNRLVRMEFKRFFRYLNFFFI